METIEIGIDWAREFVDLCVVQSEKKILEERIMINAVGIGRLAKIMAELKKKSDRVYVAIEDPNHIIARILVRNKHLVYNVNPLLLKRYKETMSISGRKDDKYDAYCLALYLKEHRGRLKPINESGTECEALVRLLAAQKRAETDRTRQINRLRSVLSLYYPSFSTIFKEFSSTALYLLKAIPTPGSLRKMTMKEFLHATAEIKYFPRKRKELFYETMKIELLDYEDTLADTFAFEADILVEQILHCNAMLKRLEVEIERIYSTHPLYEVFSSVPGCGPKIGPSLLAELGDNPEKFQNAQSFQAYAGTSPVSDQSGKRGARVFMRKGCRKPLRHTMYWLAFTSLNLEPWARTFYDECRGRGMNHSAAVRSLSNKWTKIIFSMWKTRSPYDREKFLSRRTA